ncbi:MAG: hypothetical protein UHO61_01150 [Acutalibacteraceae bacterium]|nr:hypothetical protein [Acutalibacteraceae bacterium]
MIYLPKTFERYLSALRLYVQMSVLKGGVVKQLSQLKTITLAEAFYYKNELSPIDIVKLSNSLLGSAVIILMQRGIKISASFSGNGVYLINRKLYTSLLSELISVSCNNSKIKITAEEKSIIIKAEGIRRSDLLPRLIKALKGYFIFERLSGGLLITIPTKKANLKAEAVENEWCYILDRFSPINIWLLNAKQKSL